MSDEQIPRHSRSLGPQQIEIVDCLRKAIEQALPKARVRIRHRMPVWFIGENPIVGYSATMTRVTLRFWNGQSFSDPLLAPVGKFRAAHIRYRSIADVDAKVLRRWLRRSRTEIWDMVATRNRILVPHIWLR